MQDNQRQADWAYVAGIMDADGCFMITRHARNNTKWNLSPCHLPCVKINMVEIEAIDFITSDLGFGAYKLDRTRIRQYKDGKRFGSRPIYDWYIRNKKELKIFLENIIPHLRVKKDRAQHLLDYCNHVTDCKYPRKGLSKDELNFREEAYKKMRKFNEIKAAAETES